MIPPIRVIMRAVPDHRARTGNPANKALPARPAYGPANYDKRVTMIFNDECRTIADPDGEVRPRGTG